MYTATSGGRDFKPFCQAIDKIGRKRESARQSRLTVGGNDAIEDDDHQHGQQADTRGPKDGAEEAIQNVDVGANELVDGRA
jgi:hypothetical protein